MINLDGTRTLCSYIFARKPERFLGNRSYLSTCICFILYTNEAKLCVLTGNALLIATSKSKIQVQRLDSAIFHISIEISYMPVAIGPRRLGKHKVYHIILHEV